LKQIGDMKIKAVILSFLLLGTMAFVPTSAHIEENSKEINFLNRIEEKMALEDQELGPFQLDRKYIIEDPDPAKVNSDNNMDMGTKRDAGDSMRRSTILYPGEPVDDTPGRGITGEFSTGSDDDWYSFSACEGQQVHVTVSTSGDVNLHLYDINEAEKATGAGSLTFTVDYTGYWYLYVEPVSVSSGTIYTLNIDLGNQNDAGTGSDAGNSMSQATTITEGEYYGYLDMNDEQDWYAISANSGDKLHFLLEMDNYALLADFDIHLYNPSGEMVWEEQYYYDDELFYEADQSGQWTVKIDIFPGYSNVPFENEPWDYYSYGSGAYKLTYSKETTIPEIPGEIPQPQITPIAKSFFIQNDPDSNKDEYGYMASIPACNYYEIGDRYLAPIFYQGDDTPTSYYDNYNGSQGVVDDTTQYLIDDWNDYLATYGKTALEYNVPADPIEAAADIATTTWQHSDLAVIAVDGSSISDEVENVLQTTSTLTRDVESTTLQNTDQSLYSEFGHLMNIKKKWCAITLDMPVVTKTYGDDGCTVLTNFYPSYMPMGSDWWPTTYDGAGNATDFYMPITVPGFWGASTPLSQNDFTSYTINKIAGDRYTINLDDNDAVIRVKIETTEASDLLVYLVDPDGNLRAPDMPKWNGPVLALHEWCGLEQPAYNPWREWDPEPHTEYSAEVLHPETGQWTVIVVPRYETGPDYTYTITGEITHINPDRASAAVSAANGAVIASQEHAPLLYVTQDSIPSATSQALTSLGVNKVIFVERDGIGSNVKSSLPTVQTDLTTMQGIIDQIKGYSQTENYITIASIKTGQGYIASAAMIGAYHCSPVLRIGEAPDNPAGVADRIETWQLQDGDYYHGSRSTGHLPEYSEPLPGGGKWTLSTLINTALYVMTGGNSGSIPPLGMDAKRYWNEEMHDGVYNWINSYGLDLEGKEAYCIVADRADINLVLHFVMMGNNSYAGHIPGITPAYLSAVVNRNILYPAVIYANPNRDITTSQMMNFADGGMWRTNDGENTNAYSSRVIKEIFNSHGRTYEGHCLWDAHLLRMNEGASIMYYAGHGTGGSGISAQYIQTDESNYPDQVWWDAWRGYSGYDNWRIVRNNGRSWYNPEPPSLYDIIHFDHVDDLFENLHSVVSLWLSCTTADGDGPMVYLDHGAVLHLGNAGTGLTPQEDLMDDEVFTQAVLWGEPLAKAYSDDVWRHLRDFTTGDPTAMYGASSLGITTIECIYGDPALIIYSPEWTSPVPIDP